MTSEPGNMRLGKPYGLYLDLNKALTFSFEGREYQGFEGDTIASALAANNVRVISRSFKYHRPRGILTMSGQDGNTLVQVGDEPNVRADTRRIQGGMKVMPQNVLGSLNNDYGQVLGLFGRFLPVGFYYKAFYKPKGAWRYWEKLIRRLAGLGRVDIDSRQDYTDKQYRFADVTVIGAGPAGLNAALQAARTGAEVLLVDENPLQGGSLNYARFSENRAAVHEVRNTLVSQVERHPGIEILTGAQCTGWFDDNWLSIITDNRLHKLRSTSVVLAGGSFEQPAVFRNNDLPGVMLGSAAQRLIHLYAVKPGRRAVILASNDDGYGVALDLLDAGVELAALVDMREEAGNNQLVNAVAGRNIPIRQGCTVHEALPGPGNRSIIGVRASKTGSSATPAARTEEIACDLLCVSVGYTPAAQLLCHSGGRLLYDEQTAMLKVRSLPGYDAGARAVIAGSINGVFDLEAVMTDGRHSGWAAAGAAGFASDESIENTGTRPERLQNHAWPIFPHPRGKEFIDLDEDLDIKDIQNAVAEGYDDLELVKRYSTAVMGPSQGRQSALNNLRVATEAAGKNLQGMSITTQRPPFHPEPLQLLAGRAFQPVRRSAIHYRHLELGARMMPAGNWLRPAYYGDINQRQQSIEHEALTVRKKVGLIDVSTLGKLEVRGPDAAQFMNRMYTSDYFNQPVNRIRYILMTDETGVITDDGVSARFGKDHFYVSTTTGGSDTVYRNMLRWNAEWRLDVDITNVTSACAAINIAGPASRRTLVNLDCDIDLGAQAFPYSAARCGRLAGIPVRLIRAGFVGELGWEIHTPSSQAEYLWDLLMASGQEYGCAPVGVEAQRLLRLEKGHIIVGQDTDGLTVPSEVNMSWAVAKNKPFHIGKRSDEILEKRKNTRRLVGFTLPDDAPLPDEANLTLSGGNITGRVTSVARSPVLNRIIGLAYVHPLQGKAGDQFDIKLSGGGRVAAEVATLPFYDPDLERQAL